MRIALFSETFMPHADGIATRLARTVECLCASGDQVVVIVPAQPGLPRVCAGAPVIGLPSLPNPLYTEMRFAPPLPRRAVTRQLRDLTPEIVHVAQPVCAGLLGLAYAWRHHIPVVASYHTNIPDYLTRYRFGAFARPTWRYLRALHARARLTLCTSRPAAALLARHGFARVELWAPGVDATRFHPARRTAIWRSRLTQGHPERLVVLSVGRLSQEKNLERLAPALATLPGCHLAVVGDGPYAARLRAVFAGLPVTFLGTLAGDDLADAYAAADIFALPSTTETLGLVAIEAMASGVPAVGARAGGIPDIVVPGETGLLFDPDSSAALTDALAWLAARPEERARMGHAARVRVAPWTWERATDGLHAHYRALLAPGEDAPVAIARPGR